MNTSVVGAMKPPFSVATSFCDAARRRRRRRRRRGRAKRV
jgi:hypothetical protein